MSVRRLPSAKARPRLTHGRAGFGPRAFLARSSRSRSPRAREAPSRGKGESSRVLARFSRGSRALCLRGISGLAILSRSSRVLARFSRVMGSSAVLARPRRGKPSSRGPRKCPRASSRVFTSARGLRFSRDRSPRAVLARRFSRLNGEVLCFLERICMKTWTVGSGKAIVFKDFVCPKCTRNPLDGEFL
jgi:hypothetical protein